MSVPQKRVILSRWWIDDVVYHRSDNTKGFITRVQVNTTKFAIQYYVIFDDRKGEWCDEMELLDEPSHGAGV